MTGWVIVMDPGYREELVLADWVNQGVSYALTLPPK